MGGPNLEIFKFGMYIMFPIGWMYYFGTNLDNKFSVKDFWPTKEQLNSIPTEREDISAEVERMKVRRLKRRELRLAEETEDDALVHRGGDGGVVRSGIGMSIGGGGGGGPLDRYGENVARAVEREGKGWMDWVRGRS